MLAGRELETPYSCGNKNGCSRYLSHEAGKLRNGLIPAVKATVLVLSLKTHVVRKRERYSKDRFKDEENL